MTAPRHIIILGMGLMGCDIAAIFLNGGWRVTAVEPARDRWPAAQARVAQSITQLDGDPAAASGLTLLDDMKAPDYAEAEAVIEAVPERLDLKRKVFAELDALVPAGIPIASNASGYRITDIAGDLQAARAARICISSCPHIWCRGSRLCAANTRTLRFATNSLTSWRGLAARSFAWPRMCRAFLPIASSMR
jgi:3-hydroxyacyl-CoA dehydrogenase